MASKKWDSRKSFLRASYRDSLLRVFFCILTAKLLLFTYIAGKNVLILTFPPSFGEIFVLLCLSLLIRRPRFKLAYLVTLNLAFSLLFITHSLHYKYFTDFATIYEARYVHLLFGPALDSVFSLIDKEILFLIDFPFLVLFASRLKKANGPNKLSRANAAVFLLLLSLLCAMYPLMMNRVLPENYLRAVFNRVAFVRIFGFINYQILDVYIYLTTEMDKAHIDQKDIDFVLGWFNKRHDQKLKRNGLTGVGKEMNLIVLQVESLQNFVIGRSLNGKEITPNLNRLIENSIYYTSIYDQTGLGGSSDATFLANSSLYPARRGAASFHYHHNIFDSLPKALGQRGYTTATMHNYWKGFWNSEQFEKAIGFERQFYGDAYEMEERVGWGLSDRSFLSQSAEMITNLPSPFYVFLRTLSTHKPYDYVKAEDDNFPLEDLEGEIMGNYIRSMHYADTMIGEFMEKLSEHDLLSNAVMVIYADHRAHLDSGDFRDLGIEAADVSRKIPLIITLPSGKVKDERSTVGGLIDVAPTVLNILGMDTSEMFFMGRDLGHNDQKGYVIFRDGSSIGNPEQPAVEHLMISDMIIENDMIPTLREMQKDKN